MSWTSEGRREFQVLLIGRPGAFESPSWTLTSQSPSPAAAGIKVGGGGGGGRGRSQGSTQLQCGCPHLSRSASPLSASLPRRELRRQEPAGPSVQAGTHSLHECPAGGVGEGIPFQPLLVPATPRGDG